MYFDPVAIAQSVIEFDRPAPHTNLRGLRIEIGVLFEQAGSPNRLRDRCSLVDRKGDEGLPLGQRVNHFNSKITHCLP